MSETVTTHHVATAIFRTKKPQPQLSSDSAFKNQSTYPFVRAMFKLGCEFSIIRLLGSLESFSIIRFCNVYKFYSAAYYSTRYNFVTMHSPLLRTPLLSLFTVNQASFPALSSGLPPASILPPASKLQINRKKRARDFWADETLIPKALV